MDELKVAVRRKYDPDPDLVACHQSDFSSGDLLQDRPCRGVGDHEELLFNLQRCLMRGDLVEVLKILPVQGTPGNPVGGFRNGDLTHVRSDLASRP